MTGIMNGGARTAWRLKAVARKLLPQRARSLVGRHLARRWGPWSALIPGDTPIAIDSYTPALVDGWRDPALPGRQLQAFDVLLDRLRRGHARQDFVALAEAVRATEARNPLIVEVGCSSGWNAEVLERLYAQPFRYVGIDYSFPMVNTGKAREPRRAFINGDATALPLDTASCDILVSGGVLLHVPQYALAISESSRVTRRWCIFHTVPVVRGRPTTFVKKGAYGSPVVELVFNEQELLQLFTDFEMVVRHVFTNIDVPYLQPFGTLPQARTYLCERV